MAGQPKLTQALHPIHLVESTWRGLLYFLKALRSRTQGPSLMIREGSSFSSSSLITFSVSSRFHGFTFLGFSIPRTRPNSTKSIRWAFSPQGFGHAMGTSNARPHANIAVDHIQRWVSAQRIASNVPCGKNLQFS